MKNDIIDDVRNLLHSKGFKDLNDENDLNFYSETFSNDKIRIFIKYKKEKVV